MATVFRNGLFPGKSVIYLLTALLILAACSTRDLKDQILALSEKQESLLSEKDSLMKALGSRTMALDTMKADIENLQSDLSAMQARNKALQAGNYKTSQDLKKVLAENEEIAKRLSVKQEQNDSLASEINRLRDRIAAIDREMEASQKTSESLSQMLKEMEEQRIADSLKRAQAPKVPVERDNGFINITHIGGGFGLGNTSVDYSRSLISVTNVFGYEINRHFLAGGGTGLHIYNGGLMAPVFLNMRYTFNGNKMLPFISGDGGVLLTFEDLGSSGLFINPAFGMTKKLSGKINLHISTGLLVQEAPSGMRNTFINIRGGVDFKGKR